jgi:hypothetical protein
MTKPQKLMCLLMNQVILAVTRAQNRHQERKTAVKQKKDEETSSINSLLQLSHNLSDYQSHLQCDFPALQIVFVSLEIVFVFFRVGVLCYTE